MLVNNCVYRGVGTGSDVRITKDETEKLGQFISTTTSKGAEAFYVRCVSADDNIHLWDRIMCVWPSGIPDNPQERADGLHTIVPPETLSRMRESVQRGEEAYIARCPNAYAESYMEAQSLVSALQVVITT